MHHCERECILLGSVLNEIWFSSSPHFEEVAPPLQLRRVLPVSGHYRVIYQSVDFPFLLTLYELINIASSTTNCCLVVVCCKPTHGDRHCQLVINQTVQHPCAVAAQRYTVTVWSMALACHTAPSPATLLQASMVSFSLCLPFPRLPFHC